MKQKLLNFVKVNSILFAFITISLVGVQCSNTTSQEKEKIDVRNLKIESQHPYMFVSKDLINQIKQKTEDLASFNKYVEISRKKSTTSSLDTVEIRKEVDKMTQKGHVDYFIRDCSCYGIDAYFNQDTLTKAYAKQYILSLLDMPMGGDDMPIRGKLFALGSLYDWMYDDLDDNLKKQMRNEILDLVDYVDTTWHYVSRAVVDGHSRFGNISVLVGLLPIYHDVDKENEDRYFKYLQLVVDNWTQKFNPFQTWVNRGGSHSMGWAYGASYSRFFPYIVWEYATNEKSWLTDWQGDKVFFNMYGLRNDYTEAEKNKGAFDNFPFSSDTWAAEYEANLQGLQVLFSASYYKNRHARWFYNYMKQRNIDGWMFKDNCWDILYNNFQDDKGVPPTDLAMSKYFPHSAFVIMRDNWDFNKNTLMVFKSASFYAAGHHHKDQNAFTIFYKGPLAIDAGTYEAAGGWGSNHFWNYYTRSVAHNTMLIYDKDEKYTLNGKTLSNDGGQYFFPSSNPTFEQIKEGGENHLDGIIKYEEGGDYTYTVGDATKTYRKSKLQKYTRSIVYLRNHSYNHPVMLVYDSVISTNPNFKKTYLLHSIKEPEVNANKVKITIDEGIDVNNKAVLYQETLLPKDASVSKVGGRENNQEFFVWDDGTGKPHNYNEEATYKNPSKRQIRELREAGEWRVEVSPSSSNKEDVFFNVISITDDNTESKAVNTKYVSSENVNGVIVQDNDNKEGTLVLFCNGTVDLTINKSLKFNKILVIGLGREENYIVKQSGNKLVVNKDDSGSVKSSEQGTIYIDSELQ